MSDLPNRPTKKISGLTRAVLIVSLGLNLVIVGVIVGALATGGFGKGRPGIDLSVGPISRALSDEDRAAMRETIRAIGPFNRDTRAQMRADMIEIAAILRAESYDRSALEAVLRRQAERLQGGQAAIVTALLDRVEQMGPADRTAFADRIEENMRRGSPPRSN
ncbi:MAG: periplasmic heavy metal sensor [Pseudomonadota bacterium]